MKYKKVRTIQQIKDDPRIKAFTQNYDGRGIHMVEAKEGWLFYDETMSEIGSVESLCDSVNETLWNQVAFGHQL